MAVVAGSGQVIARSMSGKVELSKSKSFKKERPRRMSLNANTTVGV